MSSGSASNVVKKFKKFRGIHWEQLPLFRGRKFSFRGILKFTEESIPKLGTEGNGMKKISFTANRIDSMFLSETCFGTEFRVVVSSAEWFGTEFQVFAYSFVPRNGIPSCFHFCGMVQNRILSVCFKFCSMVQNSEHFSPLRNGSEWNSENFLFRGTAGIPPEQTNCSVYSVFCGVIFLS